MEIGAGAHNPYGVSALNVAPPDPKDFEFYKAQQIKACGEFTPVDIWAEGDDLPVPDGSQDFVLASHSLEHMPNPIKALKEWHRVVKPRGVVFLVVPLRNALAEDRSRPLTPLDHMVEDYQLGRTAETHEVPPNGKRGHYHVFDLQSVLAVVHWAEANAIGSRFEVVATQVPDQKVGNGFVVVLRKC